MEDVKFARSHSNSPLPEAGHDPTDPLRPEIDEENATPNPPITDPSKDMEVVEEVEKGVQSPDPLDPDQAFLSDNESGLSELDDAEIEDLDVNQIAVEERPAQIIDDTNINLIGVHKRKRTDGEGDAPKKKKKRAEKPRRKKRDEEGGAGDDLGSRKSKRSRKEGKVKGASPDAEEEENLTPEERRKRAFNRAVDAAISNTSSRRGKKRGDIDLETMADAEIENMRKAMTDAAEADNTGRENGEPARHKLKLLPKVVALLNKNHLRESLVDPEINLLEAVRFFLEPLSDGSLPAYDIQKELFTALGKLPINKESLVASGIGKVIIFYIKSKRPEPSIKLQAERLFNDWTRPILGRTDDYRKKQVAQAEYDPSKLPVRSGRPDSNQLAAAARAKALEAPSNFKRARMESGPTTYTIAPKSNVIIANESGRRSGGAGEEILKKFKARAARGGR